MSPHVCDALIAEANLLIEQDLIKTLNSKWCFPVVMTRNLDGNSRLIIDFRKINEVSKKDTNPIPSMAEIWEHLNSTRYFSTLDLNKIYHQIPLSEDSKRNKNDLRCK